jgi:KDO2-lipid IV(A) lauroyltransferase
LDDDVEALTAALAARLEAEIREAPEQYFWFHRRWKSKPPVDGQTPLPPALDE